MHPSVKLDREQRFGAVEVDDEVSQRMLPAKLAPKKSAVPHDLPEVSFGGCPDATKLPAELHPLQPAHTHLKPRPRRIASELAHPVALLPTVSPLRLCWRGAGGEVTGR